MWPDSVQLVFNLIAGFVQPYYLRRHMSCHKEAASEKATLDMLVESHTSSDEQTGIRTFSCIHCRLYLNAEVTGYMTILVV